MIRMFGLTEAGNSVLCYVKGFLPYFYIPAPNGFKSGDIVEFKSSLELALQHEISSGGRELLNKVEVKLKETIQGYHGKQKCPFLKLSFVDTKTLNIAKRMIEDGSFTYKSRDVGGITFESNLKYVLRFMIDCKVTGANWIELPPKSYRFCAEYERSSHCQLEIIT
ncbi:19572_t:CDS:2, partial [Gigaspora rosea]